MSRAPQRMCVSCRCHADKDALFRLVRGADGVLTPDEAQKSPGRGVYLCKKPECIAKAKKTRALNRAVNAEVPEQLYERLGDLLHG